MTNISKAMEGGRGSPTDSPTFKISMTMVYGKDKRLRNQIAVK